MIFGHQKIRQILQNQLKNDKVSHAYLFFGPEGIGKKMVAREFANTLLCLQNNAGQFCGQCNSCHLFKAGTHPDFYLIGSEFEETEKSIQTKEIGISSVRQVIGWNKLKPILAARKVVIVDSSEGMSIEAQNAFLKSLEEPSGHTIFILIAISTSHLLETVVSRCRKIKFLPLVFDDFKKAFGDSDVGPKRLYELYLIYAGQVGPAKIFVTPEGQKEFDQRRTEFLRLFRADLGNRYQLSETLIKDEKMLLATIDLWRILIRDLIFAKKELINKLVNQMLETDIVKEAQNHQLDKLLKIFKLLGRLSLSLKETNLSPRLALDWVMTEL